MYQRPLQNSCLMVWKPDSALAWYFSSLLVWNQDSLVLLTTIALITFTLEPSIAPAVFNPVTKPLTFSSSTNSLSLQITQQKLKRTTFWDSTRVSKLGLIDIYSPALFDPRIESLIYGILLKSTSLCYFI